MPSAQPTSRVVKIKPPTFTKLGFVGGGAFGEVDGKDISKVKGCSAVRRVQEQRHTHDVLQESKPNGVKAH